MGMDCPNTILNLPWIISPKIVSRYIWNKTKEENQMLKAKEKQTSVKPKKGIPKEELEVAAYYHWQQRGCPLNDDLTDWAEVEREWLSSPQKGGGAFGHIRGLSKLVFSSKEPALKK
jgi:hypothetical protein